VVVRVVDVVVWRALILAHAPQHVYPTWVSVSYGLHANAVSTGPRPRGTGVRIRRDFDTGAFSIENGCSVEQ